MKKKKKYTKPINVSLDDKMHFNLQIITEKYKINLSDYVREAIHNKLQTEDLENLQKNNKKEGD